jgi:hypothetical protein
MSMLAAPSPMSRMTRRMLQLNTRNLATKRSAAYVKPIWHAMATP